MIKVLVYAESRAGAVLPITHELLAAARAVAVAQGGEVLCCVFAADPSVLVDQLAGADRILTMAHPSLSPYNPQAHARALQLAVETCEPDLILLGYTSAGLDLGSHISIKSSRPVVGYCTELAVEGKTLNATSQLYRGKLNAVTRTPLPAVAVLVPGNWDEKDGLSGGKAEVASLPAPASLDLLQVSVVSSSSPDLNQVDLSKAERIVCVGRGIGSADKIGLADELATALDAEIAGSRPVIDSGWLPKARQVGKSGQKVKPKLYIAAGVSGAPEHLEGMKSADFIIAINSDGKAPIFEFAHFGTTCDLFELLPALSSQLAKA
ncbi:MAG TPA: electron transfer flavoprotein subunit alpha/FixB family protein [Burkholderiaceae bacterium]|nr:electron transfer flavoprotein subunit alpha/FixB family protein [Burkholderiaceae bacterium]